MASASLKPLEGKICLVTGASRGIGKGIAKILGEAGATVYITGRTLDSATSEAPLPGSLRETAEEIKNSGGTCIPVKCDHGVDEDVEKLFDRIKTEQNGRLDVLVNNAYAGVADIGKYLGVPFYEQPRSVWDTINNVGLRSNFMAAHYAANMMVPNKQGLIVNISSPGGLKYLFNIPYGVGKAANDRMIADMSIEVKKQGITAVTLWPGPVMTEQIETGMASGKMGEKAKRMFEDAEDPTYTGKAVVALASDKNIMSKTGRILIVAELAREYGFKDIGGVQPLSFRQVKYLMKHAAPSVAWAVPEFLYVPCWMIAASTHKF